MNCKNESIRQQAWAWKQVVDKCKQLGFAFDLPNQVTGCGQILAFIQKLYNNQQVNPVTNPTKEIRYGDDKTIHGSTKLDVEVDKRGNVVSAWFRCAALPFRQANVDIERVNEMVNMYKQSDSKTIKAIIFEENK
jgi:hypothetical protein